MDFDKVVFEAIDEALSLLGERVKESIYYFIERYYKISGKEDIVYDLRKFHEGLRLIFGLGANVIEKRVLDILQEKTGVKITLDPDTNFVEAVEKIKQYAGGF